MCGGRGTRLDADVEKPLFEIRGRAMVDRVCDALAQASRVDAVHAAVSPATPATKGHLADQDAVAVVDTAGDGYVADLDAALDAIGRPAVTVAADLPLLAPEHVDGAIAARAEATRADADGERHQSVSVSVPVALKERLGASVDTAFDGVAPTGLNVVDDGPDTCHVTYDARLAVNVNHRSDAEIADALASPHDEEADAFAPTHDENADTEGDR
jgi:adenosylcobinamide-phosphate guanylyltransferase